MIGSLCLCCEPLREHAPGIKSVSLPCCSCTSWQGMYVGEILLVMLVNPLTHMSMEAGCARGSLCHIHTILPYWN